MERPRKRFWSEYRPATDYAALRILILALLKSEGPMNSRLIIQKMKKSAGHDAVRQTLRYLAEDKAIVKDKKMDPWRLPAER
jgi:hypothetical protein